MTKANSLVCALTSAAATIPAMAVVAVATIYWAVAVDTLFDRVDAILSGGALLFGQMIYREASPRDQAMHAKLDEIIHGTDANDDVAGIERD